MRRIGEELIEFVQRLGNHFRVRQHGQKVRIASPPGNEVEVEVSSDPGPRVSANVQAEVKRIRTDRSLQLLDESPAQAPEPQPLRRGHRLETPHMSIGGDQEMAIVVRITVEQREHVGRSPNHVVLAIGP